jgi:ABC-2 type transport system permease protein
LRKYGAVVRVSLAERLAYRGDLLFSWILELASMVTSILLWEAIYEATGPGQFPGFDRRQMIAYLLLVYIGRLARTPGLSLSLARDIRDGTLKKFLLQPIDLFASLRGASPGLYRDHLSAVRHLLLSLPGLF